MKKILLMILFCIIISNLAHAQIEKGDSEINFLGLYATTVGTSGDRVGIGMAQFTYGYYITKSLQIGIGPSITFIEGEEQDTEVQFSATAFFNYNFVTGSKTVPYLTGQWYQMDFDPEEDDDILDYSFINVGGGLKYFFTEYLAWNTTVTYGFLPFAENAEGGLVLVMTGLTFFF